MNVPKEQTLTYGILQSDTALTDCLVNIKRHGITLGVSQPSGKSITRLLNNGRLGKLIEQLRKEVDYVILDTPPMLAVADAEAIAGLADTALLVARADFMTVNAINDGMDRLRKSAPELCGIVLNNYRISVF